MNFMEHGEAVARSAELTKRLLADRAAVKAWRWSTNAALVDLFHELCETAGIEAFFECGAHAAEASMRFLRNSSGGRAVAVEANPYVYERFTRVAESHGVTTLNVGLGAQPGFLDLRIPNKRHAAEPTVPYASFLSHKDEREWPSETVRCEVTTLDAVMTMVSRRSATALWIDVEGSAGEVLRGAEEALRSGCVKLVMVEVETKQLWNGQMLFSDVQDYLASFQLLPVARDAQMGNTQFNVVFAKELDARSLELVESYRGNDMFAVEAHPGLREDSRLKRLGARAQSLRERTVASRFGSRPD